MWVFSVMVGKSLKNVLCPGIYKPITIKKNIAGFILKIKLEWPMRPLKIVLFLFYFFNLPYVALFLISFFWHVDFRESLIPPSPHSAPSRLPCAYEASSFSLLSESKRKKIIMHHPKKEICTRGRTTARHHLALERGQTRTPANTIWRWFPKSLQTRWQFRIKQCYYVVRNISFVSSPSKYSGRNWNMVCLDL